VFQDLRKITNYEIYDLEDFFVVFLLNISLVQMENVIPTSEQENYGRVSPQEASA
jgi:hypothetical protein